MDGVSKIIALHCAPEIEVGTVSVSGGGQNAASFGFYLNFFGKSVHAAKRREEGADAIDMAVRAHLAINKKIYDEISDEPVVFNIGAIKGGVANNLCAR